MMLLQWMILEPSGPSKNLAAVRFSVPVQIRSLRIFPTGARPFKLLGDAVAYDSLPLSVGSELTKL